MRDRTPSLCTALIANGDPVQPGGQGVVLEGTIIDAHDHERGAPAIAEQVENLQGLPRIPDRRCGAGDGQRRENGIVQATEEISAEAIHMGHDRNEETC